MEGWAGLSSKLNLIDINGFDHTISLARWLGTD